MSNARYLIGDVFERMAELPDDSVDLVLTSPPFLALRSYLPQDHPDKAKEIGSEATPAEFVDTLLRLSAEWRRLLAPHGSIAIELGDTFSGSGGAGGDYDPEGLRAGQPRFRQMPPNTSHRLHDDGSIKTDAEARAQEAKNNGHVTPFTGGPGWPQAKSLALVPEAYRFALAYGHNPHTGQPSPAGQWRIRNVIRWVRPNPPVGALGDKFRPATSEMVIATIAKDRFFDLDAVREPHQQPQHVKTNGPKSLAAAQGEGLGRGFTERTTNPAGAPPLDWWKLSPTGYAGAHYAVWPPELCVKPIKAMCPERVCRECGEPSRRVVETSRPITADDSQRIKLANGTKPIAGRMDRPPEIGWEVERTETGWTDCGHNNYRPGLVLDPFAGTGTTLAVATGHGRDAIGIDIDSRNADLARERVGDLFLTVEAA